MATTELYDIDPFYPEGEDYYDGPEPEFWFDGGAGCCPCGGPGCDGSCDTYAEYRRWQKIDEYRHADPEAEAKRQRREQANFSLDGAVVYNWFNQQAMITFYRNRPHPACEDEIPF